MDAKTATNDQILIEIAQAVAFAAAARENGMVKMATDIEQTMQDLIREACDRGLDETHLDALAAATSGDLTQTLRHLRG